MNILKIKETCLYHEVLGLPVISYVEDKHIFFRVGTSVLLCFNPDDSKTKTSPPAHYGGGQQHFAFEVPKADYRKVKDEVVLKGIKIIDEVIWQSGEESFYFNDPEGNVLEFVPDTGIWD